MHRPPEILKILSVLYNADDIMCAAAVILALPTSCTRFVPFTTSTAISPKSDMLQVSAQKHGKTAKSVILCLAENTPYIISDTAATAAESTAVAAAGGGAISPH
jgi:hypothetical protein